MNKKMLKIEILNVNNTKEYSNFINYLKNCSWESVAESFSGTPYLDHLFVDEAHRKQGIATKLVDKIIELARENNKVLYLVTVSHELFYKKLGFETIAKSTVVDCIDECFIMKKDI